MLVDSSRRAFKTITLLVQIIDFIIAEYGLLYFVATVLDLLQQRNPLMLQTILLIPQPTIDELAQLMLVEFHQADS